MCMFLGSGFGLLRLNFVHLFLIAGRFDSIDQTKAKKIFLCGKKN